MPTLRKASDRGHFNHGWLDTYHSFSFAEYQDPAHMGFSALRVINEDRVAPGAGFPMHGHQNMEILTYVISGALAHKDSEGHEGIIRAGEVQAMSAGKGVRHSEFNASDSEPVHLLQIWIVPHTQGGSATYAEWKPVADAKGWVLVASEKGERGSLSIKQDATLWLGHFEAGEAVQLPRQPGRKGWLQLAAGEGECAGTKVAEGDGLAFSQEESLQFRALRNSTCLFFELPV